MRLRNSADPWADRRDLDAILDEHARAPRRRSDPAYLGRLARLTSLFSEAMDGDRRAHYLLQETMTTSDFPVLFGDVLDRQMLAMYTDWPSTWPSMANRRTVNDFRNVKLYPPLTGATGRLEAVPEQSAYPEASLDEGTAIEFAVKKYGRRLSFSFESLTNDDLDQLKDIPRRFALAARRTEELAVVDLFVNSSGPLTSLFSNGNRNIVNTTNGALVTNPPLSIAGLQDAWRVLSTQVDEENEPILLEYATLVVPPSLEPTAWNILNATGVEATQVGGVANVQDTTATPSATGEQRLMVPNRFRGRVNLVVNPYLQSINTTNGTTAWYLFNDPNRGRPALTIGFLRGHETPEIWIKEPNARRVGGGAVDPMDGDFDADGIHYRVRHIVGATAISPKSVVVSLGTGS